MSELVEVKQGWVARFDTPVIPEYPVITKRSFMQRFTQPERTLIRKSTDDIVIDIYEDLLVASNVDLQLQDTINAIGYLKSIGILEGTRDLLYLGTEEEAWQ